MVCGCDYKSEACDEEAVLWREERVSSTRKEHRCCECGDPIPPGSRCCKATSLYDGRWETSYRCLSCSVYAEYVSTATKLCPLWGHLPSFVEDNDFDLDGVLTLQAWRERDRPPLASQSAL